MKLPIPDDWDGVSWRCIQIQWPDSILWSVILSGVITGLSRGRQWDERSGSIIGVQEIGHQIESRNFPFTFCDGETQSQDEIIQIINAGGCGCISAWEGWEMACLDLTNLIKIESGKLYVRDSCCEWHEVTSDGTGISGGGGATGTWEEPTDIDYDLTDIYPCGMATKLAEKIKEVGEFIWDNAPFVQSILMVYAVQNSVNLDLNNLAVIRATNQALVMQGLVIIGEGAIDLTEQDVIESDWIQEVTCALLPFMSATGSVDSSDIFAAFKAWIKTHYPLTGIDDIDNSFIREFWNLVADAIGAGNMADIANAGMYDPGDCDCLGIGANPDIIDGQDGWYLGTEKTVLIQGTGGFTFGNGSIYDTPEHDIYGCMFEFEFVSGDPINRLKRSNSCALSPDFCMTLANSDDFEVNVQYLQSGPLAYAALSPYLTNPSQQNLSGKTSDSIPSPLVEPLETVEQRFDVQAQGNEGEVFVTVRVNLRWLHNYASPSHS